MSTNSLRPYEWVCQSPSSSVSYLLGHVEAESVHNVSEEEEVDLALAIPVVDVADVLNLSLVNLKRDDEKLFITES